SPQPHHTRARGCVPPAPPARGSAGGARRDAKAQPGNLVPPQRLHHGQALVGALAAPPELGAQRVELGAVPARTDPEHEPPAGQQVQRGCLVGKNDGMIERGGHDARRDPDARRGTGSGSPSCCGPGYCRSWPEGSRSPGSDRWPRIVMTPTKDPLTELAARLAAVGGPDALAVRDGIA